MVNQDLKKQINDEYARRLSETSLTVLNRTTIKAFTKKTVVVLMSGGVESTTLVAWCKRRKMDVVGLYMDYGQPWPVEEYATINVARYYNVDLIKYRLDPLVGLQPATDHKFSIAFLAMRNPILLSIAINFAFAHGYAEIFHGAEKSVHPDCSPEFVDRFNFMAEEAMRPEMIPISAPFVDIAKWEVIREAKKLNVPMNLTWSCMVNPEIPELSQRSGWIPENCGECPSCDWRLTSYEKARLIDPASYSVDVSGRVGKRARPFPVISKAAWHKEVDKSSTARPK